jgi:hypothetical protein
MLEETRFLIVERIEQLLFYKAWVYVSLAVNENHVFSALTIYMGRLFLMEPYYVFNARA